MSEIQKELSTLEHSFEKGAFQKAIQGTLKLLKAYPVYPDSFGIEIPGGITLMFEDTASKIAVLEHYARRPPEGREAIMEFVEALLPTSLQIQETISLDLLVVGSSALEFGPQCTFTGDQVDTIIKHVLDKAGVK